MTTAVRGKSEAKQPPNSEHHIRRNPLHHPAVEVIQHITSPLTSALCIFGVYKASHVPKIKSWWKATNIIWRAKRSAAYQKNAAPSNSAFATGGLTNSTGIPQHRNYSTARKITNPTFLSQKEFPKAFDLKPPKPSFLGGYRSVRSFSSTPQLRTAAAAISTTATTTSASTVAPAMTVVPGISIPVDGSAAITPQLVHEVPVPVWDVTHNFFPEVMYVPSPFTGIPVVYTSEKIEEMINSFHVDLGLPWWQSMIAVTLAFRFLVLPLNVSLVRNTLRLYINRSKIVALSKKMDSPDEAVQLESAMELKRMFKEEGCHPVKNVISPFLFPPLFLSLFGAVYDISSHHPESVIGGALWFENLSVPDPTFILPVISALTWLATIEMASGEHFPLKPWILSATRLGAVACIPLTMTLPSGVFLFWITSNLFACSRAWIVRQPPIAKLFKVPIIPKKVPAPA
jgi:YidC/Oxa1 family membrane protein insertase